MRRLLLISLVCLCGVTALGQSEAPPWQAEVEQRAAEVLNGRSLVARVYLDPQANPDRFEMASIPVADGRIQFSVIKSACPAVSDSSVVLIWARDQAETAVANVLGRHIYMSRYFVNVEPRLAFLAAKNEYTPRWTFVDAQGEPIPNASVEVTVCAPNAMGDVPLYKATADEQGRLSRLIGALFILKVEHPNYGAATVMYMNQEEDPCGVYVVPLVPRDSEAFAAAAQGNVIDSDGNPVPGVPITCAEMVRPDGTREQPYEGIYRITYGRPVTDSKGWFSLCLPMVTKDFQWKGLPPAGTQYFVEIEPPKASNLRGLERSRPVAMLAGSQHTFTLPRMDTQEFFHTFAFEYQEGPITSVEELKNVRLTLVRDGREWRRLTYEQWKDGCLLPLGVLGAATTRWGGSFGFPDTELTADSPTHLEIKAGPLTLYRGKVLDAATGGPLPRAFALSGHRYAREDPGSFTDDQWQQLRAAAAEQTDLSSRAVYEWRDRVAMTDANGAYEMAFMPGLNSNLYTFTAVAPGYKRGPGYGGGGFPISADGSVQVPPIRLSPRDGQGYFPVFVFEAETGPVTDPSRLNKIEIEVRRGDRSTNGWPYDRFVSERQFTPGVYSAHVVWDRKYYTFEPVDLTQNRPATVTFRPAKIEKVDVVYEGTVIHGVTGRPMAGVIVLHRRVGMQRDLSSLTAEQWAAIRALGPEIDPADPSLAPLMSVLARPGIPAQEMILRLTKTDSNGRFALASELGTPGPAGELLAVTQDFLGARQRLALFIRPEGGPSGASPWQRLEADDKGVVSLPPMKLFPAATVLVHPVLSDPGYENAGQRIRLRWRVPGENHPLWVKDLLSVWSEDLGSGVFYQYEVQPNITQTVYVPAGVSMDLILYLLRPNQTMFPPVRAPNIRLEQGQVSDLGHLELKPGVRVTIKVVDNVGRPVAGVRVDCVGDDGLQWMTGVLTDATGAAAWGVPAHSSGRFRVAHIDKQTRTVTEESTPYAIAGEEDTGKEFMLTLSDTLLRLVKEPS